jgi:hypothetical protein
MGFSKGMLPVKVQGAFFLLPCLRKARTREKELARTVGQARYMTGAGESCQNQ